ncbi:methylenetetrahydrofolate reductase [NAD(P)H] [Dyadobacter frigoris]|uniref:Methylenetetrahydrofolate reductase n=1 Tax=Dyadobacter frigoris TaxID=2576211 RepID=A0A4U6D9Q9_9BACT|nr:methylenetetrahydrofolate reductase [NAD(P)H] [Dyadobacter frigoris]TKT93121.1 methylenetetrahydrofolate reductase [NAD(P)H] [Dyadobacter frigoris]GLU55996.1 methylenetetrahydrofolate reductase [Dyadobacter frigoris]
MTKVTEFIHQAQGKTLFSIEIIPPLKGQNITELLDSIEPLMEFKPPFVDVTYHREELIDVKGQNGLIERIPIRKRPGTVGICARLMERFKVDAVPHVICGGFTKDETEDVLFDLHYLGIDNVLVLRGDPEKSAGVFKAKLGGHTYASELVVQVDKMNKGVLLHAETEAAHTNFCIGIAGYPEKHFDAESLDTDFEHLKRKIDLGANYIVTQMFFDNQKYFRFVDRCRAEGITVPIIPGLKPLATKRQLTVLADIFHLEFPQELVKEAEKCATDKEVRQLGVEWGVQQCKELIEYGVPVLHFYTMGKSDNVARIASQVF